MAEPGKARKKCKKDQFVEIRQTQIPILELRIIR